MPNRPSPLMMRLLPLAFVVLVSLNAAAAFAAFVLHAQLGVTWAFVGAAVLWGGIWWLVLLHVIGRQRPSRRTFDDHDRP